MSGPIADGEGKVLTLEDLIEAMDKQERTPSNVPEVNTFHFNGERVSDWLDLVEQALVGLSNVVKFQPILKYVLHVHHLEVEKVINAANGSWARFKDGMQRKYRLGDGLLTTVDLEAMNRDDFTTVGAFVQEFKKNPRKVHGISEEAQCTIFFRLLPAAEAAELISHGGGSKKLTWATIDKGVAEGSLDEVEQYQMRLQRRKRKERDATTSGTQELAQAARTRGQAKAAASQEPTRKRPEPEKRKEVVEVEDDDEEEEEDERLRQEEAQRAEQRARKREAREEAEPILRDVPPKKKKYAVRLEEGFDAERVIDRLLEDHNDLMTLKEILAPAPKLRDGLKGRLSRRLVPSVHLSTILPKEAEWAETGTKMDWKCVACAMVDLMVKGSKCAAMVDTGAEMNIIREADTLRFGVEIDRSDCGILHGSNCKAVLCGTASNVLIEVGRVNARACFFAMPDVDHRILPGRAFLWRTEMLMFNKHNGTLILIMCDLACGNYEVITCRNTGHRSIRNRPNPGSFTIEESEGECRRLLMEPEEEERVEAFSLRLSDVNKVMDIVATHEMEDPDAIEALREQVMECPQAGELELVYRLPGGRMNSAPMQAQAKAELRLVLKLFEEEDPWGSKDVHWMMKLTLAGSHSLVEEMRTIEEGPDQVEKHEELMGGMYLLINTLLQGNFDEIGSLNPTENEDVMPESQNDEFEEGEIKEAFRAEEYDGIYLELRLFLSCEMRDRDASDRNQRMRQRYLVRDGHLFVKRQVRNPRRVICSRNHQIDVIAALHGGIAGGHRGVSATYAKISELYYLDGMMKIIGKFCRSCVPCQERSRLRSGEPLHPRLEREVGAVVHLDLLFMPLGDHSYNYIFDARDNLFGFVDGRVIHTNIGSVLVSCIDEYYMRYPFVREFVLDRGSEFTCQEVQELLSRSDFAKTAMPRGGRGTWPPRRPFGALGGYERHGSRHRESTPVYDDGDIELFLDDFRGYAERMGSTMTRTIERLRGAGRFAEPIAQICTEARMQELRPSPVGPDGRPIRLEIRNVEDFIPAFEQFMHGQGILRDEWERQRLEKAGALPDLPAPPKPYGIKEMWDEFLDLHDEGLTAPERAEVGTSKKADEYLDRKICFLAKTSFDRYMMLEADMTGKKMKEMSHGVHLEAVEAEVQELRALVASQAAIIQDLRQQPRGGADRVDREGPTEVVDRAKSSQRGEERRTESGLSGRPSAAEHPQGPPMGRVILKPEEAKTKREAEREAFGFRVPTELATLPITVVEPTIPLSVEEGRQTASSEPVQGSAEGSMDVLLEAVHTMQKEASLFSPEQRVEGPPEREMGIAIGDVIEGGPQRLDTPEYRPEGIVIRPEPSTQELGTGPEEPLDVPRCHEVVREASETPSLSESEKKKKRGRRSGDLSCFFCKSEKHRALQCPKFLKDLAEGKVTESGGRMYDRQGRVVERSADGGRA
ncbi:hypothetical protein CBR_g39351 [Chara braunii]|uniref:Integrase zinc-binding domain-containing protein n=1 Tax=Chara braunii TaxID=69332 RepID=A0A388LRK8_CHABU|nr:hypothetical protein CBR_g39351 [Chara braunii]|eukprot:GBG84889.1 hypothetical protein CBR_g39351 [Chara braunii]